MKKSTLIFYSGLVATILLTATIVFATTQGQEIIVKNETIATTTPKVTPTHAQEVWIYALEWCESRGVPTAINKVDRDGTPSYYSYQFKPSTFRYYGEMYEVLAKGKTDAQIFELMKDYDTMHAIVTEMVLHRSEISWKQQFPDCVRKLGGGPPKY